MCLAIEIHSKLTFLLITNSLLVPFLERDQLSTNNLIYTKLNINSGPQENNLDGVFFVSQWATKQAQCQVTTSFWISLADDGNRPKSKQNASTLIV